MLLNVNVVPYSDWYSLGMAQSNHLQEGQKKQITGSTKGDKKMEVAQD